MARLHQAQRQIAKSPARFKVLRCGRRFGKTTYAVEEMTGACLFEPGPVAYFATTRDQARDIVWAELLEKVIGTTNYVSHNEQRLEVTLRRPDGTVNRIRLFGWENIETARGKKYSLVVLDELDSMRAFEKHWREIIRATLADYRGAALFMGTPKGYKSLYRLEKLSKTNPSYAVFHFTSYDNPFLDPEEIEEMRGEMTATQFAQEVLAEYHKMEGLIYEEFHRDTQMVTCPFVPAKWLLSIDFGYNHPLAAGIYAIGSDESMHLDRMIYKTKLGSDARAQAIRDLIGNTQLDEAVGDSEDPLAIDTLNKQLDIRVKIKPVIKGQGSVLEGINKTKALMEHGRLTMDPSCEDLAWEKENYSWKLDKSDNPLDEPVKEQDDACFVAGTMIRLSDGRSVPIETVRAGDTVWTPLGPSVVRESRQTGYCVCLDFGAFIATPNHKLLSNRGIVRLDTLRYTEYVWHATELPRSFTSTEFLIAAILTRNTVIKDFIFNALLMRSSEAAQASYTETSGTTTSALSPQDIRYIMQTDTTTTARSHLSYLLHESMASGTLGDQEKRTGAILKEFDRWLQSGTQAPKAAGGTSPTLPKPGKDEFPSLARVTSAVERILVSALRPVSSVIQTARPKPYGRVAVFNLATEHGMYVANDILVSNCDMERYAVATVHLKEAYVFRVRST